VTAYVNAELLKLRTVRSTWGFVVAVVALAALVTAGTIGSEPELGRFLPDFQSRLVVDATRPTQVLALLLGCIIVTSEFRHGTLTPTLLVLPRRDSLLAVKLVTAALAAVALTLAALVVVMTMAGIWLMVLDVPLEAGELLEGAAQGLLAVVLGALLGAAAGSAIQSQVAALVGILVWIFVAEPLVWGLLGLVDLDEVGDYLPSATVLGIGESGEGELSLWTKVAVGLGWIALGAALGALRLRRRDVT
jgi:ABC-2 type transport system permease protein